MMLNSNRCQPVAPLQCISGAILSIVLMGIPAVVLAHGGHGNEKETRDILSTLNRQNRRLTQLVADLLLLTRMEQQPLPIRHQCCLNDVINDLVEELATLAIAAGVKLTSDLKVHKPLNVVGNEEQLYLLVSNLIVNAIQYTPTGGQVTVILDQSDH